MEGTVFSIEEFSVYDGPGIRTTAFLKGCPLRCTWCHNPEGQERAVQIVRSPNGCCECGQCRQYAETVDGVTRFTEASMTHCPNGLLRYCGTAYTADELCQKLLKNKAMLVGGGVTFSGGEPLSQPAFLCECLERLKGQIHTAVQTCGYAAREDFKRVLALCDYVLFDIKIVDDALHRRYTGCGNDKILSNFRYLAASNTPFVVRVPLIPGVTDTERNITDICELLTANGVSYVELMPYNPMAGGKYKLTMRTYNPQFDTETPVQLREEIWQAYGIRTMVL